jgi:hypothetical protein
MIRLENRWTELSEILYGRYAIGDCPETALFIFLQQVIPTLRMNNLWGGIDTSATYKREINLCTVIYFRKIHKFGTAVFSIMSNKNMAAARNNTKLA